MTEHRPQLRLTVILGALAALGPLSDRFGRRPPLVSALACVAAPSLWMPAAAHFAQVLGGCAGMVVSRAMVRDVLGVLQSTCGAVASTAVSALADGTARPLATVTLACASAATVLVVPWALAPPARVHD